MSDQFLSIGLEDIITGETLPTSLYIYAGFRFITFRAKGDVLDRVTFERLEMKKVRNLFILEKEKPAFMEWSRTQAMRNQPPPLLHDNIEFPKVREDAQRKVMDIFHAQHPDKVVVHAVGAAKMLVNEVMKFPYAVQTLAQLQTYSRGTVDHSVNVSILSTYLAMQMGYTHTVILQHVGTGALLHDIGKTKVQILDEESNDEVDARMKQHPIFGARILDGQDRVPNEVRLIVEQHHEAHDGTGYPKKLRGSQIYDLSRIVAIANAFDELVTDGSGSLIERQRAAVQELDQVLFKKFDPQKLEKSLRILKLGI